MTSEIMYYEGGNNIFVWDGRFLSGHDMLGTFSNLYICQINTDDMTM